MSAEEQAKHLGEAWERLPSKPKAQVRFKIIEADGQIDEFYLGAHAPRLSEEEISSIHEMWRETTREKGLEDFHHKGIVTIALQRLKQEMKGKGRHDVLNQMRCLQQKDEHNQQLIREREE
jgi:hypothetical protein